MVNRFYIDKRYFILIYFNFCGLIGFSVNAKAQSPIFVETFGDRLITDSCDQGTLANGFVTPNGVWNVTSIGINDSAANEWYISSTEPGLSVNSCAVPGCYSNLIYTNRTLHVGNVPNSPLASLICATGDCGAIYDPGGFQNAVRTNKRAESPSFSMPGQSTNLLVFNYIQFADDLPLDSDKVLIYFYDGNIWSPLPIADPPVTTVCGSSSVRWEQFSVQLPVIPVTGNVKIGFLWMNDNGGAGISPSFAVDSIIVYNQNSLVVNISPIDTNICSNNYIDFFADSVGPGAIYNWVFTGGVPSTSTLQNPDSIFYVSPNTYAVQLTVTTPTDTISVTTSVFVNPCIIPTANFIASDSTFCDSESITFLDLSTNGATGWIWSFPGGVPSSSLSPQPPSIRYDSSGIYDVKLIAFNQFGSDTLVKTAYINVASCPIPVADFNSIPVQFCPEYCVSFTDISSNGPMISYQWFFPGALVTTSSIANPSVCYAQEGLYDVQLIVTNQFGSDTELKNSVINVQFLPAAFASPDTEMFYGSTYQLIAGGGTIYSWEPSMGLDNPNISNPIASPTQSTTYTVTISDPSGCTTFKQVSIRIIHSNGFFVPNTFSPNGDGRNDYLFVRGNNLENILLIVFDRWGEKVFETTNSLIGWDGTYKGNEIDPGVFTYVLKINYSGNESFTQSGTVTLVR